VCKLRVAATLTEDDSCMECGECGFWIMDVIHKELHCACHNRVIKVCVQLFSAQCSVLSAQCSVVLYYRITGVLHSS
jgi:hypothetical protein